MTKRTITFRIDDVILNTLRHMARTKVVTLNRFVEEILTDYGTWHAYANKVGFIPFPKEFLIKISQQIKPDVIQAALQQIDYKKISDMVLFLEKNNLQSSFISGFESWLKASDFTYKKDISGQTSKYLIYHNLGDAGSELLGLLYSKLLQIGNLENVRWVSGRDVLQLQFDGGIEWK